MSLENNIILNLYSVFLLFIIYFNSKKHHDMELFQNKIFLMIIKITGILLIIDMMSRFDGEANFIYPILNSLGNFLLFSLGPILPSLWFIYIHDQINQNIRKTLKIFKPLLIINVLNIGMVTASSFFGWIYFIDESNVYHRGPLFFVSVVIILILLLSSIYYIAGHKKKLENKYYNTLLLFSVPPLFSIILQIYTQSVPVMLNSLVLSTLIVFLNIQNKNVYTDHLTGVFNRKRLEKYLYDKVSSNSRKGFAAILIDIDEFKYINDTFGHNEGDRALKTTAIILESCLRSNDFIARFGGDEFFIVLDTSSKRVLAEIVNRIERSIAKHNSKEYIQYKLNLSMGYDIYDPKLGISIEDFQKSIDVKMYQTKREGKDHQIKMQA